MTTAFISGHTDLNDQEFQQYYVPQLQHVISEKHNVVLGNAPGADTKVLEYLLTAGHDPKQVTVYIFSRTDDHATLRQWYIEKYKVSVLNNWTSYNKRDTAMTFASDYDLCWVRSEEECRCLYGDQYRKRVSGTEQNLIRRKKHIKQHRQ